MVNAIRKIADGGKGLYQDHRRRSEIEKSEDVRKSLSVQATVMIRRSKCEEKTT